MFHKLKEISEVKEGIQALRKEMDRIKDTQEGIAKESLGLKTKVEDACSLIGELKKLQHTMISSFEESNTLFKEQLAEFEGEMRDVKLLPTQLQDQITRSAKEDLSRFFHSIKVDIQKYEHVKKSIISTLSELTVVKSEMQKLVSISSKISKQDFNMVNFADKMEDLLKENNVLQDKVDSLERIISRMRRQ